MYRRNQNGKKPGFFGKTGFLASLPVRVDQKKPIATPGNIARQSAVTLDVDFYAGAVTITGHVGDGDLTRLMQRRRDNTDRRLDSVLAR